MEQNVIFMYPLCPVLTQLKSELEKDSTLTVFEVDMVEEYCQLIPSLDRSITFSADIKKTTRYLELLKTYLTKKNHFNIFVSKQLPSGLAMTKMEKNGLNEAYPDYTKLAVLQRKVDSFFKVAESFESSGDNKKLLEKNKKPADESELRVEKLFNPSNVARESSDPEDQEVDKKKAAEAAALDALLGDVKTRNSSAYKGEDPAAKKLYEAYVGDLTKEKKDWEPYTGEPEKNRPQAAYEGDLTKEKKDWEPYTGEAEKNKSQAAYEGDLTKEKKDWAPYTGEPEKNRPQAAYEGDLRKEKKDWAPYTGEPEKNRPQAAYEGDLRKEKKDWAPYTGEPEKNRPQAAYEGDLRKEKKDWAPYTGEAEKNKSQAAYDSDLMRVKSGPSPIQEKNKLGVKHLAPKEVQELSLEEIPEIIFYPAAKVLDPVAFFVEIMLGNWEADFKKKFLKMSLHKVYQAHIFITQHDGSWEEDAPEKLKSIKAADFVKPVWIDEGTNMVENIFILPVAFDEKIVGSVGLIVPGKLDHAKMGEMEFWCYLGRCLWN